MHPDCTCWLTLYLAIEQSRKAFSSEEEEERKERLADIEEAFDKSINDADYARKLYLIEHCIFGVDIQPIAVQISKLRFFISLVVDQKPTDDAAHNFGIRPLPNLESKFVAANTLIPVDYDASLFESTDTIISLKEQLKDLNHQIFLAKRNVDKQRLKDKIKSTRKALAKAIEDTGFVKPSAAQQLADWDMFEQNTHAEFFDAEWMFGIKGGFDIVIANPPYIRRTSLSEDDKTKYEGIYSSAKKQYDIYLLFIEMGIYSLHTSGYLCYINPIKFFNSDYGEACRKVIIRECCIKSILDVSQLSVFENAMTYPCVLLLEKKNCRNAIIMYNRPNNLSEVLCLDTSNAILFEQSKFSSANDCIFVIPSDNKTSVIIDKIDGTKTFISSYFNVARGLANSKVDFDLELYPAIKSKNVDRYNIKGDSIYIDTDYADIFSPKMVVLPRTVRYLKSSIKDKGLVLLDRIYYLTPKPNKGIPLEYIVAIINSKVTNFWFEYKYSSTKVSGNYFDLNGNQIKSIPLPINKDYENSIISLVVKILAKGGDKVLEQQIDLLVYHLYGLTYDEVLIVDPETPITREEYEKAERIGRKTGK